MSWQREIRTGSRDGRQLDRRGSEPLYVQLARMLARHVTDAYELPSGRLPHERQLCEQFRVSRQTVRAALAALERRGLIYRVPRHGTYVTPGEPGQKTWFSAARAIAFIQLGSLGRGPIEEETFYGHIYKGVTRAAGALGLTVKPVRIYSPVKVPLAQYTPPPSDEICGAVLIGTFDEQYIGMFDSERIPAVVVDYWTHERQIDSVAVDVEGEAYLAIRHLADLGHTSLGFVASGRRQPGTDLCGFDPDVWRLLDHLRRAAQQSHVQIRDEWVTVASATGEPVERAIRTFLSMRDLPTALLCFNNDVALPLLRLLSEGARRCPENMSVISRAQDNTVCDGHHVTHLRCDPEFMGQLAVRLLLERIRGQRRQTVRMAVGSRLVRGTTTGPPT